MPPQPVIILGSGIAGLTLGRCLSQKGIPSIIYERATSSPRHNYGITLHEWAYNPLLQALKVDEHTFRRRIAVDSLYHAGTGKIHAEGSTLSRDDSSRSFRANRSNLEQLLREGQNIKWEHTLTQAQASSDGGGSTSLTFQNNLKTNSSFIVDTLGVHSQLRKLLLPNHHPKALPYVVFSGKRNITHDQFLKIYAPHFKDANTLTLTLKSIANDTNQSLLLLQIWINDHLPNSDIEITYVYSRAARLPADPLHNPTRPLSAAPSIPPSFFPEIDSLSTHPDLQEPFLTTFSPSNIHLDRDRLLHWLMRTLLIPAPSLNNLFADSGVAIIGDSAHAMPVLGGEGANHAMRDGVDLAGWIASGTAAAGKIGTRRESVAMEGFYEKCEGRWREGVRESGERIESLHSSAA